MNQILNSPAEQGLHHRIYVEHALHYMADQASEIRRYEACSLYNQVRMTEALGAQAQATAELAYGIGAVAKAIEWQTEAVERQTETIAAGFEFLRDHLLSLRYEVSAGCDRICHAIHEQTLALEPWVRLPDSQKQYLHDRDAGKRWLREANNATDADVMETYRADALELLQAANRVSRFDPAVHMDLGFLAIWHQKDLDAALYHFGQVPLRALDSVPLQALGRRHVAATHYLRFVASAGQGTEELQLALKEARTAVELVPSHSEAQFELVRYEALVGERLDMLEHLESLLRQDRSYAIPVSSEADLDGCRREVHELFGRLRDEYAAQADEQEAALSEAQIALSSARQAQAAEEATLRARLADAASWRQRITKDL